MDNRVRRSKSNDVLRRVRKGGSLGNGEVLAFVLGDHVCLSKEDLSKPVLQVILSLLQREVRYGSIDDRRRHIQVECSIRTHNRNCIGVSPIIRRARCAPASLVVNPPRRFLRAWRNVAVYQP